MDAVLLFTNILLQGTIDLDVKNLFNNEKYFLDISKDSFCELLTFTMNETTVIFNNEQCQQLDGVGMGPPQKPTFTNIFLSLYEVIWLTNFPLEF